MRDHLCRIAVRDTRGWRDGRGFEARSSRFSELRIALVALRVPAARLRGMGQCASLGEEAVSADLGRVGEKSDFFSILLHA